LPLAHGAKARLRRRNRIPASYLQKHAVEDRSNIVYDEAGTLYCYDRVSSPMIRRPMAYIGHEKSRGTLKYRCPAKHDGLPCAMSEV